jgi:DNA-binding NarL/FixJ family response regulator
MASKVRHIVVISDDTRVDRELRQALSGIGEEGALTVARTRKEVEASPRADLILLDLELSAERPADILYWLRTEPSYHGVPVFALGSDTLADDVTEAYKLGANSCLLKYSEPSGFEKLARAISTYASLINGPECGCTA